MCSYSQHYFHLTFNVNAINRLVAPWVECPSYGLSIIPLPLRSYVAVDSNFWLHFMRLEQTYELLCCQGSYEYSMKSDDNTNTQQTFEPPQTPNSVTQCQPFQPKPNASTSTFEPLPPCPFTLPGRGQRRTFFFFLWGVSCVKFRHLTHRTPTYGGIGHWLNMTTWLKTGCCSFCR